MDLRRLYSSAMKWLCAAVIALPLLAQSPADRPGLLGIAHLALGFEESFAVPGAATSPPRAFVKINDRQWIELIEAPTVREGQLDHVALYTADAERMRHYLAGRGVQVPEATATGPTGDRTFTVIDPDGHRVEFVEYRADSRTRKDAGAHLPATRISERALHVGILVVQWRDPGLRGDLAGKRGQFADAQLGQHAGTGWHRLSRVHALRLGARPRPPRHRASFVSAGAGCREGCRRARLPAPRARRNARSIEVRTGINRKRQVNLFDPDGTRVELMEPETVDGQPTPPSTLPPPH
jgi:lactoylglutathione lyase